MAHCPGMERWKGKVAIVTGASSGVGRALSKKLAELGTVVVGCARKVERIEALASEVSATGGKVVAMKCDVSKEEDILSVMSAVKAQFGGADICVNCAGVVHISSILEGETTDWQDMMEVNVIAQCIFAREFVKQLKERNVDTGHLFLFNSNAGHSVLSIDASHFYSATQFAVTALTEGIRKELRDMKSNIKVTSISSGLVATEFTLRAYGMPNASSKQAQDDMYKQVGYEPLQADDIADCIIFALSTAPRVQIHDIFVRPTQQED